jgi:hypothetical protein
LGTMGHCSSRISIIYLCSFSAKLALLFW